MTAEQTNPTSQFGDKLRRARAQAGMSQEQLGELLEVTGKTVCLWEQGKNPPHVRIMADLFEVLQVSDSQRHVWIDALRR
tara:strand:+ start:1478 stop:1717 length:240 start_codon:yes stop_codon:yes gene_type:complete